MHSRSLGTGAFAAIDRKKAQFKRSIRHRMKGEKPQPEQVEDEA